MSMCEHDGIHERITTHDGIHADDTRTVFGHEWCGYGLEHINMVSPHRHIVMANDIMYCCQSHAMCGLHGSHAVCIRIYADPEQYESIHFMVEHGQPIIHVKHMINMLLDIDENMQEYTCDGVLLDNDSTVMNAMRIHANICVF